MPTKVTTRAVFALGDSLTLGGTGSEVTPWPQLLRLALGSVRSVGNQGFSGSTVGDMATRYATNIQGQGFIGGVLMGGINDINAGTTGAAILATYTTLVNTMLADGLKVLAATTSPFGTYVGWNATKQGHLDTLNAGILLLTGTGLTVLDGYAFMEDPGSADDLNPAYAFSDGLHWNQAGCDAFAGFVQSTVAGF